jgi:UDP-glucose 4-epimerase
MSIKFLITGGAGSIGSFVSEHLCQAGHQVIVLDNAKSLKIEHLFETGRLKFVQDSVLNREVVGRLVDQADVVIHLAAIADPKRYVVEPLNVLHVNLGGSLILLDFCARQGKKFLFASTSEICGKNNQVPWNEDADRVLGSTRINRWCYSTAKAAVEHYCYAYHQQEGLPFVVMRFFNVYGPRCDDLGQGRVIPIFLERFLGGLPVTVHGDGKQTRAFTYIEDTARAVVALALEDSASGQVYNVGSDVETSILELAQTMKRVGGFDSPIEFQPHLEVFGESYEDIPRRIPDVSRIEAAIGWRAETDLETGLSRTIEYYRSGAQRG